MRWGATNGPWVQESNLVLKTSKSSYTYIICLLFNTFYLLLCIIANILKRQTQIVFPRHRKILEQMGVQIRLARKRRKFTTIQVAERANISRSTLYHIERGSPTVALGAVFNVLCVLGLEQDFLKLAADDVLGRKLQDLGLNY